MKDFIVYIPVKELKDSAGTESYETILEELKRGGFIKDHVLTEEITVDGSKALHFQAIMEFYKLKSTINRINKKED
jgi:hypothetical protein